MQFFFVKKYIFTNFDISIVLRSLSNDLTTFLFLFLCKFFYSFCTKCLVFSSIFSEFVWGQGEEKKDGVGRIECDLGNIDRMISFLFSWGSFGFNTNSLHGINERQKKNEISADSCAKENKKMFLFCSGSVCVCISLIFSNYGIII